MDEPVDCIVETPTSLPEDEGCNRLAFLLISSNDDSTSSKNEDADAPITAMRTFVVFLAIYEKTASGLGTMAFIWATVVLLGGFATSLEKIDVWFVTVLLLLEAIRIVSRSSQLVSVSLADEEIWLTELLLQVIGWLALSSFVLCSYRLSRDFEYSSRDIMNIYLSLHIFYYLCLVESILILLENAFLQRALKRGPDMPEFLDRIIFGSLEKLGPANIVRDLISQSSLDYGFHDDELGKVPWLFFYHVYSQCINGSVFDGFKIKFLSYIVELLQAGDADEQLKGIRVLSLLAKSDRFSVETLMAITTTRYVVERLIEMLNWNHKKKIRKEAAAIISELLKEKRNRPRVMAIPASMESIASLLYDSDQIIMHKEDVDEYYLAFSLPGLRILESLANDDKNCAKIRSSRVLLTKFIGLTELNPNASKSQIETAKLALQITGMLALKKRTWDIVFAIRNFRGVLRDREIPTHDLQILAINRLTSLALDQEDCEIIGGTGGVLRNLFSLCFIERNNDNHEMTELITKAAGEALGLLSLENKHNCQIMMRIKLAWPDNRNLIGMLISVLDDPIQGIHAARILRNLCIYAETKKLNKTTASTQAEEVLAAQMFKFMTNSMMEKWGAHQEAAIGLAAQMFRFMTKSYFEKSSRGLTMNSVISKLVHVFQSLPSEDLPSIRRFSIELLIAVMEMDRGSVIEMRSGLETALEGVIQTTSEMESYNTFSRGMGLGRYRIPIQSLVQSAMELVRNL